MFLLRLIFIKSFHPCPVFRARSMCCCWAMSTSPCAKACDTVAINYTVPSVNLKHPQECQIFGSLWTCLPFRKNCAFLWILSSEEEKEKYSDSAIPLPLYAFDPISRLGRFLLFCQHLLSDRSKPCLKKNRCYCFRYPLGSDKGYSITHALASTLFIYACHVNPYIANAHRLRTLHTGG